MQTFSGDHANARPHAPTPRFYVCRHEHHHERVFAENLSDFFGGIGIGTKNIIVPPGEGQRPQLGECLASDTIGILGFNSELDHSYIGSTPFLDIAADAGVPAIQWVLDHPSSRLAEFGNSTPSNARFLFSSQSAELYFRRFGIPSAPTATVACVGPSRHSRAEAPTSGAFNSRPIHALVAMNLKRIGGTIDEAWLRVEALPDPLLRNAVKQTIERSRRDVLNPLEGHLEQALIDKAMEIPDSVRNGCVQMVEEIVQIERRMQILEVARHYPVQIQSDAASRPFQAGSTARFEEDVDMSLSWSRLKLARAGIAISNMHDMVHDRILNGLNAGCLNIIEDSYANRQVFTHGVDALFFNYGDDSLREAIDLVLTNPNRAYEMAAAGLARRDQKPFRFGKFANILALARQPLTLAASRRQ